MADAKVREAAAAAAYARSGVAESCPAGASGMLLTLKLPPQDFVIVTLAAKCVTPNADADNSQALDATEDEGDAEAVSLPTTRPASKSLKAGG